MKTRWTPFRKLLVSSVCVLLLAALVSAQDVNVIESIKSTTTAAGAAAIAITVKSSREFPVRALPLVLVVGSREFSLSLPSEDGGLNRVIFTLTPAEFARTSTGERIFVQFGHGEGSDKRDLGTLNKALLDK